MQVVTQGFCSITVLYSTFDALYRAATVLGFDLVQASSRSLFRWICACRFQSAALPAAAQERFNYPGQFHAFVEISC